MPRTQNSGHPHIEMFYKPIRRHSTAAGFSPVKFEQRHFPMLVGVEDNGGDYGCSVYT